MTLEERQHFEDIIVKAVQSGKKETSDLVDLILHRMEPVIKESIDRNVNGKIVKLTEKIDVHVKNFDDYIILDTDWKDDDKKWKAEYEPYLKGMVSIGLSGRIIIWTIISLGSVAGAIVAIKKFFE